MDFPLSRSGDNVKQKNKILVSNMTPFTTVSRKTDPIFEFLQFFCRCHTVNTHLIALKFLEGFVNGLICLGKKLKKFIFIVACFTPVHIH